MLGRTKTLASHASRLRKKLRLADADRFVVNVWGDIGIANPDALAPLREARQSRVPGRTAQIV